MKEAISIFNPKIARSLLKKGYKIIDIKPTKENPDKTIFIFRNDKSLMDEVVKLNYDA